MPGRPALSPAEVEAVAWQRVLAAHEQLQRALDEHRAAADRLFTEAAARAVEDARMVRSFRALLPFTVRRRPLRIPAPRRPG